MKSVAALHESWAQIASLFDPLVGDPQALVLLYDPADHAETIAGAIDNMKLADEICGGGLSQMGYSPCFDPSLWRRGSEAVMQARLFQILSIWRRHHPDDAVLLDKVLVRGTFYPGYALATPHCTIYDGAYFLVVPFAYTEFLMLSARAFTQALSPGGEPAGWEVLSEGSIRIGETAPPAFRHLVARILTADRFDPLEDGDPPVDALAAEGGWFAGASEEGEATPLEFALSYCALDFALSHEMAHRVAGHLDHPRHDALLEEIEADDIGLRLYGASHDWRDELLDDSPLSRDARILLGPLWFFHSASLLLTLKTLLGERLAQMAPDSDLVRIMRKERDHLTTIAVRWEAQVQRLAAWRDAAGPTAVIDSRITSALADACEGFIAGAVQWIAALGDEDILHAARG